MSELTVHYLRCEYLVNPLGIDERQPRLSWVLESDQRGQRQTAYQILTASTAEQLAANDGDLWDSGKVSSSQSVHIVYEGRALQSGQRCWWKVRVWDGQDSESEYSEPAFWEMGILSPDEWHGYWIGSASNDLPDLQPSPYLRRVFTVTKAVRRARLYATAKGLYELRVNGGRVGDMLLTPGWTDYDRRIQYQTYDVTGQIQAGDNAIGAILGTGWYAGYAGFDNRCKNYGARPQLLLQLHVVYEDGSEEWIVSDERWKVTRNGAIRYSDLLMGECVDARLELPGWDMPDYDDAGWEQAAVQPRNTVPLVADRAEPVKLTQEIRPKTMTPVGEGVYVADMGQNMVGWARLLARGQAGERITLRFAEMLNPDGTIYTANLRSAAQTDTFILRGEGVETFEPRFTFHGFRYVEITDFPGVPTVDDLTGCVVHSATPPTGSFECSNLMVNQLQQNILWGQRGNFLSVPTDCPQRNERLGWLGDAQVFVRTACANMDVAAFFTKWMTDIVDAQGFSGAFPCVAPRLARLEDGAPAWGDAGVIIPWTMYQVYGDRRIIERCWDAMARWMDYLQQANPGLLWQGRLTRNYGDWLSINADTPKEVLATAYFAYDAALMARMAGAIGRDEDAERYQQLFASIKAAFVRAYVSEDGRIKGDTQTVYVLALYMDLLPDPLRALAAEHLIERVHERGWHISTGFVGVSYLCPALTSIGAADVAYRLLTNETYPSWGYSIKHGATTIWERWDGWTADKGFQDPGMNSFNHYAYGSIGQWMFQTVAGIDTDPAYPGFERIIIRPQPGGSLTYARAEFDSIRGRIISDWQLDGDTFTLRLTIPANTSAMVYMPTRSGADITESGLPAAQAEGVTFLHDDAGCAVFEVGSGRFTFSSRVEAPVSRL